jgi:hypothetical protein
VTTPIRAALVATSFLRPLVKDGVQALKEKDRPFIDGEIRASFADSLALDAAFEKGHEQEHRWDYLLGHGESDKVFGFEPHTARNDQTSRVIRKRQEAMVQLRGHLRDGVRVADWFWVASGKVDFLPMEKAVLQLDQNGITFVGKGLLQKHLKRHLPATGTAQVKNEPRRQRTR